jgi:CheY-like chemotaxis protein
MNGFELIQNIKKLDKFLPIIILSELIQNQKLLELIHMGIIDYIPTPINEELLHTSMTKSIDFLEFIDKQEVHRKLEDEYTPIEALNELYKKNIEIQLISNYKGISIIHTGKIVEIYKDIVQIQTRKVQTKAIEYTKRTILESEFLPKDIQAELIDIDNNNAEVSLSNLKYNEYTPKRRKKPRIVPSADMKLMAYKKGGTKLNVDLKDISLNSLTFEIRMLPDFFELGSILDLKIAFNIPEVDLAYYVDKMCIINFPGKIVKINEEGGIFFIGVEFEMPKLKEDIFHQYMYYRELAIIKEFKHYASKKS